MCRLPDKSVDMVLCDLPYGQTARNKWDTIIPFEQLWKQYERIIKDNGVIVLFANGMFTSDLMHSNKKMWRYNLIWNKTTPTGYLNSHKMPMRSHEDICVFYKKLPTYNPQKIIKSDTKKIIQKRKIEDSSNYGKVNLVTEYNDSERYPTSVLVFSRDKQKGNLHPTQKPVPLLEYLIRTYTSEGEIVLDNCMGSGSTAIACINTNRQYIGFELDKNYFNIANSRIQSHLSEISTLQPSYANG